MNNPKNIPTKHEPKNDTVETWTTKSSLQDDDTTSSTLSFSLISKVLQDNLFDTLSNNRTGEKKIGDNKQHPKKEEIVETLKPPTHSPKTNPF